MTEVLNIEVTVESDVPGQGFYVSGRQVDRVTAVCGDHRYTWECSRKALDFPELAEVRRRIGIRGALRGLAEEMTRD